MNIPEPTTIAAYIIVILLGLGFHEYAHAKFADMAGDPTPRLFGRVTLNLFKHFDPLGSLMMVITILSGYGIGWGRPVPMDSSKMRNPRWDHFIAVLAGPMSNFLQAVLYAVILRVVMVASPDLLTNKFIHTLLLVGVVANLSLCFFNLIPLGPLDGMWVLGTFFQEPFRYRWTRWNLMYGQFLFLGLILFSQASRSSIIFVIIGPPIDFFGKLLVGQSLFA